MNKDLAYHKLLHKRLSNSDVGFSDRILTLHKFNKKVSEIHGTILDVGCGNGYASVYLLKTFPNIKKIYLLENSEEAVKNLIPKTLNQFDLNDKFEIIHGSFDNLNLNIKFDFIVSFGAIHHSSCLFKTVECLKKNIKDDGFLILSEPSKSDFTTHAEYVKKYDTIEIKEGIELKNKERNDHFYRVSEYKSALIMNGFDILFENKISKNNIYAFFKKIHFHYKICILKKENILKYFINKFFKIIFKKKIIVNPKYYKPLIDKNVFEIEIYSKKSSVKKLPHLWEKLR
jgi:SAM-dependent methyltransferase